MNIQPIPHDQIERVVDELRKVALLVEEIARGKQITGGLHAIETRWCLAMAGARLQETRHWVFEAIKAAQKAAVE